MSSYRSVNFHEICRICTAHAEHRINIFSTEGKCKNLCVKIAECLPLTVDEKDRLPKVLCEVCLNQVEEIYKFRNICKNSQNMLSECLKQATQQNSGKVYIKDAISTNSGKSLSVINNARQNNLNQIYTDTKPTSQITSMTAQKNGTNPSTISTNNNDILNTIMQSIGIQSSFDTNQTDKAQMQNYSITMDNKESPQATSFQYKSENLPPAQSLQITQPMLQQHKEAPTTDADHKALTEFLKMKPNIKVTPLGKNNAKKVEEGVQEQQQHPQQLQLQQQLELQQQQQGTFQQSQQLQFQPPQIIQQPEQLVQLQQPLSAPTTNTAATIQLQQLQQQLQQYQLQQQLQHQIQQITSQLQPQQTITFSTSSTPGNEMSPSKNKKPKLNFVLTSPPSQTLTATLPQLAMTAGAQQPQIQLQLQSPQPQSQPAAAALFSNFTPLLQQQQQQTQQAQHTANTLQTATTTTLMSSPNKCYLPITIKDENSDQEFVAHIDAKNFVLPATYQLQMKLQPQIATVDGQPIMQLTPTSIPATLQLAASALNNQSFHTLANNNMLQALPMQPPQQQLQHQQLPQAHALQQQQQVTMKSSAQITSQQIIRAGMQLTNDAATSTNDQIEDFIPNNMDNSNKQSLKQEPKTVIKQQRYRLSQNNGIGAIEIKPTNFTQQIMQPVQQQKVHQQSLQQQQTQVQNQHSQPPQQQQQEQPQHKQQQKQHKQVQGVSSLVTTQQQSSVTVQRITNNSTIKQQHQQQQQAQPAPQQQPVSNTLLQAKVPMLQKKDVTISRISNTPQTPQQQHQQKQALLKLLPATKVEVRSNESQLQRQKAIAQELQALIASSSQTKVGRKPNSTTAQQQQQQSQLLNTADNGAAVVAAAAAAEAAATTTTTTTVPHQNAQQQQDAETDSAVTDVEKVGKNQGMPAHGVGPNGLECSQCGRVFKKKEHLTQHVKLHAGLRPFKCKEDQCGKAFSRKEHLMRHEISHTGRKLFSCDICHKPFSRKDNLNKHRRIHTTITNVYTCEICTKQFVVKAYYEEHKQMHEDSDSAEAADTNNEKTPSAQRNINTSFSLGNTQVLNRSQQQTQLSQQPQQQQQQYQQQQQQQQQLQQYIQPAISAIPPSFISTNQPQTQQIQLVQQETGNTQYQQQQPQHQPIMQLQMPTVVSTQDMAGNTITITQSNDPTIKATIGSHDAAVLNLPPTLANLMQLSHAQFVNPATGQIMGHIKIEK